MGDIALTELADEDVNHDQSTEFQDDSDGSSADEDSRQPILQNGPERLLLPMPSNIRSSEHPRLGLERIAKQELRLRRGHANDCLQNIRTLIGQRAFHYRNTLRAAADKTHRTRARATIYNVQQTQNHHCRLYIHTREAMIQLGISNQELTDNYKVLVKEDLVASTVATQPNAAGQSQFRLSWIWTTRTPANSTDNHLTECELHRNYFFPLSHLFVSLSCPLVAGTCSIASMDRRT